MKKYLIVLVFVMSAFLIESCSAPTTVTSWSDPVFKGKSVKKVMVLAMVKNVDFRKAYENQIALDLTKEGVDAVNSLAVFNFEKKYSAEELGRTLQDGNYDGLLVVKYLETDVNKRIHPSVAFYDYYWGGTSTFSRTGYYESHKTVKMEVSLFSPKSKTPIWYATTKTWDASDIDDLSSSLAKEVTADIKESGFIK
jgi:hypothetical protein